jgi:hypothetical protein
VLATPARMRALSGGCIVGKLALVFGLLTLVSGWFSLEELRREGRYEREGKVAQVQLAGSQTQQRETMKGRRGRSTTYEVDVTTLTYRDANDRKVEFRRDTKSFPPDLQQRFAAQQPVYIEYIPGEARSERWQGKGGGWKVTAAMFLLFGAAFVFFFRRGLTR